MLLTTHDIARLTSTPTRTIRARLAAWRDEGGPVVTLARRTRGRPPLAVHLADYAARVARDPAELRAELAEHQVSVARGVDPRGRPPRARPSERVHSPFGAAAGGGFLGAGA